MSEAIPGLSLREQRQWLAHLSQHVLDRVRSEASTRASKDSRDAALQEQFSRERQQLTSRHQSERGELQANYTKELAQAAREYESVVEQATDVHNQQFRATSAEAQAAVTRSGTEADEARERIDADHEQRIDELKRNLHEFRAKVDEHRQDLRELESSALAILRKRFCRRVARDAEEQTGTCDTSQPIASYVAALAAAQDAVSRLERQWLPKAFFMCLVFMIPIVVVSLGMLLAGVFLAPAGGESAVNRANDYLLFAAGGSLIIGFMTMVLVVLRPLIVSHSRTVYDEMRQQIAHGDIALDTAVRLRSVDLETRKQELLGQRMDKLKLLEASQRQQLDTITLQREEKVRAAADQLQRQRKQAAERRDERQKAINAQHQQQLQELNARQESQLANCQHRERQEVAAADEMYRRAWTRLVNHWQSGMNQTVAAVDGMWSFCQGNFPEWQTTDWERWQPPEETLPIVKFGSYVFRLASLEGGLPDHQDLQPPREEFRFPAVVSFAEQPALLLEAWDDGRAVASQVMQNVMLRLLTSLPYGRVRMTIIDAAGLGQNFSAFMHLADFDEKLVTHRIWTEPNHINQRLADLTEHMEDVIQAYLRNEFRTIDEYNRQAGEVAEPYHLLVIANFPAGFTDESAQRLMSIVSSGARCGVYTLINTDSKLDWPRNFDLADLEARAATLQWTGQRFCWRDEVLKTLPLDLDVPPSDAELTRIIRIVGKKAKNAIRVEVPFSTVAPKPDQWWSQDSRAGIDVALGRAGASKLQHLRLGHGTSQHVLISGKTGSGKSTLLHALITNTALAYGPDEVEFYLVDFKKGVEFKPYAAHRLPHARVVAIESEREFGMSVLERLDRELRVRGDLFRQAGVQDIRQFRDANPDRRMPRVLLVIDEFQEFFTQDDRVAQEAALLMDRLVRQGRAFGIHVLLGSQTLAGAYSLARSTLGQMAVRIALQCSEADSHLILSEDNTAARLLSRPGEAIYNDANGLFEGNHPFQVVWLAAGEQEDYLQRLSLFSAQQIPDGRDGETDEMIVFEGNAPADPAGNRLLRELIVGGGEPGPVAAPRAWLGSAVAIKEPTAAVFRRQSGANLLVVGQQEELALATMANAVVSLAAHYSLTAAAAPRFVLFDGTRPDAPEAGWWQRFAEQLPWPLTVVPAGSIASPWQELAQEISRRVESGSESDGAVFLLVHNLGRFRDLRRSDDDYGLSSFDDQQPVSPSKLFAAALRDGPSVGVHSVVWCDTLNTVNRWLDRATLREFDQRVLFQMSANDSSNLMDSPAASRLGQNRALLHSEELGQFEKFRPYGLPPADWLTWIRSQRTPVARG